MIEPGLRPSFLRIRRDLDELHKPWALIGGLAVSLRAEPRSTVDVDVAVFVEGDPEAESLTRDLVARGYRRVDERRLHETRSGRLAMVELVSADGPGYIVDLMFALSGIEPEVVRAAERLELEPGLAVPVARTGHLLALKILAGRDRDRYDVALLMDAATSEDVDLARRSLSLIEERGERTDDDGRSLHEELDEILVKHRTGSL